MAQSSKFVQELINKVDLEGFNNALSDIIQIIELNSCIFINCSIEVKIEKFGLDFPYYRKLAEIILTRKDILELGDYFLLWAGTPDKIKRIGILSGLKYFPGSIGVPIILEIIQKYGEELTYSNLTNNEIEVALYTLGELFSIYRNRDFDAIQAREFLTEKNPLTFLEKHINFPNDDENGIAVYAKELLEDFSKILNGYSFRDESNELYHFIYNVNKE